jgi:hypothetical protein
MISRTAKKPTALRTVLCSKLIGADRFRFGKNKASGILLPNAPSGIGESAVSSDEIPCSITPIPGSSEEQGIMPNALGLQRKSTGKRNALKWSEVSKIAC